MVTETLAKNNEIPQRTSDQLRDFLADPELAQPKEGRGGGKTSLLAPIKADVHYLWENGYSAGQIAQYAKRFHGITIGYQAVWLFIKKHFKNEGNVK